MEGSVATVRAHTTNRPGTPSQVMGRRMAPHAVHLCGMHRPLQLSTALPSPACSMRVLVHRACTAAAISGQTPVHHPKMHPPKQPIEP